MALKVADAATAAKKFATRGAAAAPDYKDGVANAGQDWLSRTAESEENYQAGVQEAISRGAFGKGVRQAGAEAYTKGATTKGAQRFASGIQGAANDWAAATQPFLDAARGATLTPRGPKGSPQNQQRASEMAAIMRRKKVGG
jgi:hypothetical protein